MNNKKTKIKKIIKLKVIRFRLLNHNRISKLVVKVHNRRI